MQVELHRYSYLIVVSRGRRCIQYITKTTDHQMPNAPGERELIKADVLETLASIRCLKDRMGGVPATTDELLEWKVTKNEELLLDVLNEMAEDDDIPLEYASKRQRTVWLTDRKDALAVVKEIYQELYD